MAKAKKLPSGSWRCLVYSHTEKVLDPKTGQMKDKRVYESFTSDDPSAKGRREVERKAAEFADSKERTKGISGSTTFGEALDAYIALRTPVLSPRTIMDYKRIRKKEIQSLMDISLNRLTQEIIQAAINEETIHHSPKTVRNTHGLISAVLRQYRPDMRLTTALPKRVRANIYVPTDSEIQRLMAYVSDTALEIPVLLAAFGPMRRGEICALTTDDISGNRVHVCKNMVLNGNGGWIVKTPKSYAGDRYIDYPSFVSEKWKGMSGSLTDLNPNSITSRFATALRHAELPSFRFHDLRHYSASIQHALGIPDAYIMQRGGWGSDGTLKAVYRHTLDDREKEMSIIANEHFEGLCNTRYNTKTKNP